MLKQEQKAMNLATYVKWLKALGCYSEQLLSDISEKLVNVPYSADYKNELSYSGSLLDVLVSAEGITKYANTLNQVFGDLGVDKKSLLKVLLLNQLGKAVIFTPDDTNGWTYAKLGVSLRCGERSLLMCHNYGITFTDAEAEAMLCLDAKEDDNFKIYYGGTLSRIVMWAHQMLIHERKVKTEKEKNG